MKGHDWGILTLRLTAIYLFLQALLWGGTALFTLALGLTEPSSMIEDPWKIVQVEASLVAVAIFCYAVGLWYWTAAPRLTAPILVTDERPSIADERIAPILIAVVGIWGTVNLVPALRSVVWELVPAEKIEISELVDEGRRFRVQYEYVAIVIAGIATFGCREVVAVLIYAKRNIKYYRLPEIPSEPEPE